MPPVDQPERAAALLPGWRRLLATTEGRLLAVGLAMALGISAAVGIGLMLAPADTLRYAAVVGLNLVIGRAAGMSYGIASDLGMFEVVVCNLVVETAQVLVLYPLFVLGWQELIDTRRLQPLVDRLRHAAEAGHGRVRRFGIAGVFVFVFMPFWMTGPVIGAIIGFLLGIRASVNLAVVLSATMLAVLLYARFLGQVDELTTAAHPYAVFVIVLAMVTLAWLLHRWLRAAPSPRPPTGSSTPEVPPLKKP